LLLSFLPDIGLAKSHLFGATWPYAFALMAMHIPAWAVCVTMLPNLTRAVNSQSNAAGDIHHAAR